MSGPPCPRCGRASERLAHTVGVVGVPIVVWQCGQAGCLHAWVAPAGR